MAQGIYLIENNLNNKKYIGQSVNIKNRWTAHKNYKHTKQYCKKLYQAFDEFGINNFTFSVLEEVQDVSMLTLREQYWINHYNSIEDGYNCINAVDSLKGENNPTSKLTEKQVDEIKELLLYSNISCMEIACIYNIHFSQIYRINRGELWVDSNISYPIRKSNLEARNGSINGMSKLSEDEVLLIRQRYINESVSSIYEDYKDLYSLSGFKKLVQGTTFKNVPIYNKTSKTWIQPK